MIKSDRKIKELSMLLNQKDNLAISAGIELLREDEPFEGAIGLLVSHYDKTEDQQVRKTIENFLNDLKDQSVSSEVITEIRKPFREETINMLVASCWQSGLDYSAYSHDFVDVFLNSDYMTALECLTVMESSVHEISHKERQELIGIIEDFGKMEKEKGKLTGELISVLRQEIP
jgi:predicted DNA-binding protein